MREAQPTIYSVCRTKDNAVLEFETRGNVRYLVTFCRAEK